MMQEESSSKEWVQFEETRENADGSDSPDTVPKRPLPTVEDDRLAEERLRQKQNENAKPRAKPRQLPVNLKKSTAPAKIVQKSPEQPSSPASQASTASPKDEEPSRATIDATQVQITVDKKKGTSREASPTKEQRIGNNSSAAPPLKTGPSSTTSSTTDVSKPASASLRGILKNSSSGSISSGQSRASSKRLENGKHIETVYAKGGKCVWVTKATFDPEDVPDKLLSDQIGLGRDSFSMAVSFLVNDHRFGIYSMCYRRIIVIWLLFSFVVLFALIFSGLKGLNLFAVGVVWLVINAVGIIICLFLKRKWDRNLDDAVSAANQTLAKHNLLMCMEDKGRLSCHKIMLHFYYYDIRECVTRFCQLLLEDELKKKKGKHGGSGSISGSEASSIKYSKRSSKSQEGGSLNSSVDTTDTTITPVAGSAISGTTLEADTEAIMGDAAATNMTHTQRMIKAEKTILRFSQHYLKSLARDLLNFPSAAIDVSCRPKPQHVRNAYCLCQFAAEQYFRGRAPRCYSPSSYSTPVLIAV